MAGVWLPPELPELLPPEPEPLELPEAGGGLLEPDGVGARLFTLLLGAGVMTDWLGVGVLAGGDLVVIGVGELGVVAGLAGAAGGLVVATFGFTGFAIFLTIIVGVALCGSEWDWLSATTKLEIANVATKALTPTL